MSYSEDDGYAKVVVYLPNYALICYDCKHAVILGESKYKDDVVFSHFSPECVLCGYGYEDNDGESCPQKSQMTIQ